MLVWECMMSRCLCFLLMSLCVSLGPAAKIAGLNQKPVLSGPHLAYQGSQVQFECEVPDLLSPLTFELWKDTGLIATEHNVKVTFDLEVTEGSEGEYFCRVTSGGVSSNTIHFQTVIPVLGARVSANPHLPLLHEGQTLVLRCVVRKGTHLSFSWFHDQHEVNASSGLYRINGDTLTVDSAGERHAGIYSCMAENQVTVNPRFSSSPNIQVIVKKHISQLSASLWVWWDGAALQANISCAVASGSPPLLFSLLLDGRQLEQKHVDALSSRFSVPIRTGQDLGFARCRAQTDTRTLLSDPVHLHVVPVGGAVRVMVTYLHDVSAMTAAALLKCIPERGTFPQFSWSVNHSSLPAGGDALSHRGQILILTDIGSGYYRCRVRDSFNESSEWLESAEVFVQRTDPALPSMEVIALVFCCFLSMVIVGGSIFMFWSIERKNHTCKQHSNQCVQTDLIIVNAPAADVSPETQTLEMKTVIMEFEA
ncbi:Fc receptor-like protein 2 isoform X2 [Danio aesculapii]|uniref:Fc receptor-like protein 2 isoform X2 n=1 Tax=Danio aesculapii TaxID=1142201 RepID=UPI0024C08EDE|nr:Fc receptor-like protein 2 isoform X2 [Danio aesculapii]